MDKWAVVCTDLHLVVGPIDSLPDALAISEQMTAEGHCVFIPVQMTVVARNAPLPKEPERKTHLGQYL